MKQGVTMSIKGLKEIDQLFRTFPKQVSQDKIWAKFWKETTKPLVKAAKQQAPVSSKDHKYPREKNLTIKSGTLKESIQFFRTKASKEYMGGYIGPRVKGKFKKEKGGFYGAFVEYGDEVNHYGKFKSKSNPFMKRAWNSTHLIVLQKGMVDAEKVFDKMMKAHERRLKKYGRLGY
tara:strand:+ start:6578 stop:7105 length:528 start_codon:yes stop_codon:yes gene_type:complete